jgi:hypothetical protein
MLENWAQGEAEGERCKRITLLHTLFGPQLGWYIGSIAHKKEGAVIVMPLHCTEEFGAIFVDCIRYMCSGDLIEGIGEVYVDQVSVFTCGCCFSHGFFDG